MYVASAVLMTVQAGVGFPTRVGWNFGRRRRDRSAKQQRNRSCWLYIHVGIGAGLHCLNCGSPGSERFPSEWVGENLGVVDTADMAGTTVLRTRIKSGKGAKSTCIRKCQVI